MNSKMADKVPATAEFIKFVQQYEPPTASRPFTAETFKRTEDDLSRLTIQERNPRQYKYLPSQWTTRIPLAGRKSFKGPQAKDLIFYDSYNV
jgi:hypothetical protein